ncbi:MAG: multiprotein bridging factor aMBF1 [Nanoarchaeota archaeon]
MQCDMCGKETDSLRKARIEGIEMQVCASCVRYGEPVKTEKQRNKEISSKFRKKRAYRVKEMESEDMIVDDYAQRIRTARQKKQLVQKAVAVKLAEKESVIHAIETGKHEPDMDLARRLERLLGITLIEKASQASPEDGLNDLLKQQKKGKSSSSALTLGDVISIRKRK